MSHNALSSNMLQDIIIHCCLDLFLHILRKHCKLVELRTDLCSYSCLRSLLNLFHILVPHTNTPKAFSVVRTYKCLLVYFSFLHVCLLSASGSGWWKAPGVVRWSQFLCVTWILGTAPYVQIWIYSSLGEGERWQKHFHYQSVAFQQPEARLLVSIFKCVQSGLT